MKRCPVCGRAFEGKLEMCPKCYSERRELVDLERVVVLIRCPRCGLYRMGGKWKEMEFKDALSNVIIDSMRIHPEFGVKDIEIVPLTRGEVGRYLIGIIGTLEGELIEKEKVVEVRIKGEVCERCCREAGGYYESVVQVRADGRDLEEDELEAVRNIIVRILDREKGNQKAFVSKIVERREGFDFYFGDRNVGRKIARTIANELGGKIVESKKIHTRRDGKDVYRFTYAVRLPGYREGDIVEDGGKVCVVTNRRLGRGITVNGEKVNLRNPKVIARREDVLEAIVVDYDEYILEVLHPLRNEVVRIKRPRGEFRLGDVVKIVEYRGRFYVIPNLLYLSS